MIHNTVTRMSSLFSWNPNRIWPLKPKDRGYNLLSFNIAENHPCLAIFPDRKLHVCRVFSYIFPHVPMIFPDVMRDFQKCEDLSHIVP